MAKKAVLLLSGGMDSYTTGALAKEQGFELHAVSFAYGQRHRFELEAARRVQQALGCREHQLVEFNLRAWGGSALTAEQAVPKGRPTESMGKDIPVTYVPARNTIFLSFALGFAEAIGAFDLFIGANAVDYSGYPDCRPEYLRAFEEMANLATKAGVEGSGHFTVHAPLLQLTKAEIIKTGLRLGVDYGLSHSCYDPDEQGLSCGECDACRLRLEAFAAVGMTDPVGYRSSN